MDRYRHIYEGQNVPEEDKARLDGYLRGRAEADELARIKAQVEELMKALDPPPEDTR